MKKHPLDHLDADILDHIEQETKDNLERGMAPEEARFAALRKFGNVTCARESVRAVWIPVWIDQLRTDLHYALRSIRRAPGVAAVSVLTLALGISATVAIFTIVNSVLLRPLPYFEADHIVSIRHHAPGLTLTELRNSPGLIAYYREHARLMTRMAGYETRDSNLTGSGSPERVRTIAVTPELFDVLATRPQTGRQIRESDALRGAAPVVLLTHRVWQARFGGDPTIVGRQVEIDGRPTLVIGVMPRDFAFPDPQTQLLVPLWLDPKGIFGAFGTHTIARLAPGATVEATRREMDALQNGISERFGIPRKMLDDWRWSVTLEPLQHTVVGPISRPLWVAFATVGVVLLIAGANVANLFLVRAEIRRRELALRSALGATRSRIALAFLAESVVLALAGGILGLLIAAAGIRLLIAYGPADLPRLHEVTIDSTVVLFTGMVSLLTGAVLGVLPLIRLPGRLYDALALDRGLGSTPKHEQQRARQVLVVTQVAMALVLLVACTLMLRTVSRLYQVDPGVRIDGVVTVGVSLGAERDRAKAVAFYHQVLDAIAELPSVRSVGATNILPIEAAAMNGSSVGIESRPRTTNSPLTVARYKAVTAGYFETSGMRLVEGRAPLRADSEQGQPVVWVNNSFAREYLGNRAIGERLSIEGRRVEIVGVVSDVREFGLREAVRPTIYMPLTLVVPIDVMYVVVQSADAPVSLAASLGSVIHRVGPSVPVTTIRPMEEIVAASIAQTSFTMTLLSVAAIIALVLGLVGLYGVTRHVVTQRTNEIGIRMALGAQAGAVRNMILRQTLSVALFGVAVGLAAAYSLTQIMTSLLFGVSSRDPAAFGLSALTLTAISFGATYVAATRATAVNPLVALRCE